MNIDDLLADFDAVLDRVEAGETITIERDGRPVARLVAVPRWPDRATLQEKWRNLPPVDAAALRADIDAVADPSLPDHDEWH